MDYPAAVDLSLLPAKLAGVGALLGATPAISAAACAFFLVSLGGTLRAVVSRRPAGALALALAFACFSGAMSLAVPLAFDSVAVVARYLIGFYLLPLVLAPAWLCRLRPALGGALTTLAAAGMAAVLAAAALGLAAGHRLHGSYYPDDVACLDRAVADHGYRFGVAGYWDAKYLQALSRNGIAPAQYAPGPVEYRWITTGASYRPAYDYAIVSDRDAPTLRLSRDGIEAIDGPPDVVAECGAFTLLGYDGGRMVMR